jgi:GT2 family glycosyltransferase
VNQPRPQLSVVLSTLGNYSVLRRVLDGYERQAAPAGSFELLVVVDAADPDPSKVEEAIGARPYQVKRLTGRIPGLSANRNTGWRAARGPVILFTDNDTIPGPRLISEHIAWHQRFPKDEVVVTGLVRWAKGLRVTPFMKWLDLGVQFEFRSIPGEEASWAHVYGANSSIKRAFLERVGGYDEERLPYGYEDIDWGYRAREYGLRVKFNRGAVVDHWRPMTVEQWQTRAARLAWSEWQFCQLHPDIEPWFHRLFRGAMEWPILKGRAARLAGLVPQWLPWVGPAVWRRAGVYWAQQIAPSFFAAWDAAASGRSPLLEPAVAARREQTSEAWSDHLPGRDGRDR